MDNLTAAPAKEMERNESSVEGKSRQRRSGWFWIALSALASLRLTVFLFALALILVFAGTLAQVEMGIWTAVSRYFRSVYVFMPFQLFVPATVKIPGGFPFPGGWLIGGALMANLLAAHAVRFKLTWARSGILLIHSGLVVMMLSEFITGVFANEGIMTIVEKGTSNYLEDSTSCELAIIDPAHPDGEHVAVIRDSMLKKGGLIHNDKLPFDVQVVEYMVNSGYPTPTGKGLATKGDGVGLSAKALPEVSGTDPEQKIDVPSAYVTIKNKRTGEDLGTYLVTLWWSDPGRMGETEKPQKVQVDGKTYDMTLRMRRTYKPYTIYLKQFKHDLFPGTALDKQFASTVRLIDPVNNQEREVEISMNRPLFYEGESFYQSGWIPGDLGTRLQVVHNPGRAMPYISCFMVSLGMLIHFGIHLTRFLRRELAS